MGRSNNDLEPAELKAGGCPGDKSSEHIRAGSPSCLPRDSIQDWLQGTADIKANTSTSSRKRKRSNSSIATPSPPPEISESYLNLEEVEFNMPPQAGSNYPTTPSNSKTPKSKGTKISADAGWVKQRLAQLHLYQGNKEAFNRYPEFKKKVFKIVDSGRHSEPRPDSQRRFEEVHDFVHTDNEATLLDQLIPMIIPLSREVPFQPSNIKDPESESSQKASISHLAPADKQSLWLVKFFWDSGCARKSNVNFRNTFLPLPNDLAAAMSKDPDKEEVMTNPRPDYVYGLTCTHFAPPEDIRISRETQFIREIVPSLYDCMLVIEGKSDRGEAAEAENQACRSGAALVNAARMLRERIGDEDVVGADERTFVFSGTLCPDHMELWAHWAEVRYMKKFREVEKRNEDGEKIMVKEAYREKHVDFHMNLLQSASLRSSDFLVRFRPFCNNILDWGCIKRYYDNLRDLYDRIYAWEQKRIDQAQPQSEEPKPAQPKTPQTPSKSTDSAQPGSKRQRST